MTDRNEEARARSSLAASPLLDLSLRAVNVLQCARCCKALKGTQLTRLLSTTSNTSTARAPSSSMFQGALRTLRDLVTLLAATTEVTAGVDGITKSVDCLFLPVHEAASRLLGKNCETTRDKKLEEISCSPTGVSFTVLAAVILPFSSVSLPPRPMLDCQGMLDGLVSLLVLQLFPHFPSGSAGQQQGVSPGPDRSLPSSTSDATSTDDSCECQPPAQGAAALTGMSDEVEAFYPDVLHQATKCITAMLPFQLTPSDDLVGRTVSSGLRTGFDYLPIGLGKIITLHHRGAGVSLQKTHLAVSLLVHSLVMNLQESLLPHYESWVRLALQGVGLFGSALSRRYFTIALKSLVPLAPLAMNLKRECGGGSSGKVGNDRVANLISSVLCMKSEEDTSISEALLEDLSCIDCNGRNDKSLDEESSGEDGKKIDRNSANDSFLSHRYSLRNYQLRGAMTALLLTHQCVCLMIFWAGVEWVLSLWGGGLGGILADDMVRKYQCRLLSCAGQHHSAVQACNCDCFVLN